MWPSPRWDLAPLPSATSTVKSATSRPQSAVEAAWQAGVRYFDTAPHYGLGLSERRLGRGLAVHPRDEYVISTKVGRILVDNPQGGSSDLDNGFAVPATLKRVWDFSADGVRRSLEDSLRRLGHDRVDIVLMHDPDESPQPLAALEFAYPALDRAAPRGRRRRDRRRLQGSGDPGQVRRRDRCGRPDDRGPVHPAGTTGPRRHPARLRAARHQRAQRRRLQQRAAGHRVARCVSPLRIRCRPRRDRAACPGNRSAVPETRGDASAGGAGVRRCASGGGQCRGGRGKARTHPAKRRMVRRAARLRRSCGRTWSKPGCCAPMP